MSSFIYQEMGHTKRVALLKKLCKTKEQMTYAKSLTEAELVAEKGNFARDAMRISQLEDELKMLAASYKEKIKALKKTNIERLEVIANEKRQAYAMVYGIPDNSTERMLFYDEDGELITSREMLPNEKQGTLFLGEKQQTANTAEAEAAVAEDVLAQFPEGKKKEEAIKENEPEYEPSHYEDAPDETDLEKQQKGAEGSISDPEGENT